MIGKYPPGMTDSRHVKASDHSRNRDDDSLPECPHGHGEMISSVNGDPLEPDSPYCPECGHIIGNSCEDGCHYESE